jgi:hypothetical protein
MRTKTIIDGFKNSQKFRFILTPEQGEAVGMTITIKQMSDQFATRSARIAVWTALNYLAYQRGIAEVRGETLPTGLVREAEGFRHVQVDLH